MRRNKLVTIFDEKHYSEDFPTDNLLRFADWLNEKIAEIPNEHRSLAVINIDSFPSYGDSYVSIEISYTRPETDGEMFLRANNELARKEALEAEERKTFERLNKKFGGK